MAAFDWWLLIVGLVIGAGLVWLILADASRRESEILEDETPIEAAWISATLADEGTAVDPATTEQILRLHRMYLESLPPDEAPTIPDEPGVEVRAESPGHDADEGAGRTPGATSHAQRPRDVPGDPLPARDR